ncbi:alpha/beta hydrolase family protein [Thermopolyspora flexuosa]|uniref:Alpha/beta hydrolase family protein n=1 Tax=Thermopolyspora flexuosa TaxID=103836 RepID=A0A543IXE1_9ACTN|nr:alpha/beta hydrolase family protein [Thermopolyspora flexuosa]
MTQELEAGLSRIVKLAEEHAYALDNPARAMAANAWVGGGAPVFAQALEGRRTGLQQAFTAAAEAVAEQIRRLGGQASAPRFVSHISVASAVPGRFSGMDVGVMTRLVADLDRAARELPRAGQRLVEELTALSVVATPGRQVAEAGLWAQQQVTDLRRRLAVLQREHPDGTASRASAAFGLFGGHAPDPDGVGALTAAAATGDRAALGRLLELQATGKDATLAFRLNAWWRGLDEQARDRLIATAPDLIGRLNGLPSAVRDQANRRHLEAQRQAITAELARLRASAADAEARIAELELKMRQIAAVDRALALGGRGNRPPALLLDLYLGKDGKAAISYGDPDEADNVVAYVPGTGTTLEGFAGDALRAVTLWDEADRLVERGKKIASIAWLGYDAPQWDKTHYIDRTVVNQNAAKAGVPALVSFTDGLHAAHKAAAGVRLTVLGHSYGSTLAGLAAQARPKTFADQLIAVGSPGLAAATARDLGVGSVWVGEAPNDPVGDVGSLPLEPTGTFDPLTGLPEWGGPLGPDPSHPRFGANQFYVEDTGDPAYTFKAHSSYWDIDPATLTPSASLRNIARLVNGQYDRLVPFPKPSAPPPTVTPSPTPAPSPAPAPSATPTPSPTPAGG